MAKETMVISNEVSEIQVLTERIAVLAEDLTQEYFCKRAKDKDELKAIAWLYYDRSGVKMEMILSMILDVDENLKQLQESLKWMEEVK